MHLPIVLDANFLIWMQLSASRQSVPQGMWSNSAGMERFSPVVRLWLDRRKVGAQKGDSVPGAGVHIRGCVSLFPRKYDVTCIRQD